MERAAGFFDAQAVAGIRVIRAVGAGHFVRAVERVIGRAAVGVGGWGERAVEVVRVADRFCDAGNGPLFGHHAPCGILAPGGLDRLSPIVHNVRKKLASVEVGVAA